MAPVPNTTELDLRDYLAVLHRRRFLIAAIAGGVLVVALLASVLQTPIYRATAEVLLRPRTAEHLLQTSQINENPQMASTQTKTEMQVMQSNSVRDAVADKLGFRPAVSVRPRGETDVVAVSAESADATEAAEVANTYAETYIQTRRDGLINELLTAIDEMQAQINQVDTEQAELEAEREAQEEAAEEEGETSDDSANDPLSDALAARRANYVEQLDQLQLARELASGGAQVVSRADVPVAPIKPTPVRNGMLGLLLGLVLGIAAAFLRDHLDDSLRTKEDLERASGGVNLLGMVPAVRAWRKQEQAVLVSASDPRSAPAEAYRTLRTSFQFLGIERPTAITHLTSPGAGEGKTTTLSNLGVTLARAGQRVLLVDCDLRRPRLHEFFETTNDVGFTSLLLGMAPNGAAIREVQGEERLSVLPSGPGCPNPAEVLASTRAEATLRSLAAEFDCVLVDGPPVLPVTDALVLAGIADATIVVAAADITRKRDITRAFELLHQVNAPVIGAVLNGVTGGTGYGTTYSAYTYTEGNGSRSTSVPSEAASGPPQYGV